MEVSKYILYGKKPLLKAGSEYEFWMDKWDSGGDWVNMGDVWMTYKN